ncbi:FtsX-like permease family protein [Cellulomonas sp. JZ18]|uniref:ABC transporter permease n=1 Tax=Cellulomonas sp. JZ18 TaxID=2654191 RepID=UPI0012D4B599|nr:ABC transporter permease [Cellulomonas sp. JZ18]QGQ18499.1 FtsX-like permease family protein [Cellulomonas sp. JZ18]
MSRVLRSCVHDLRARPLRTVLTALSMLVGVLAVVGVSAADQLSTGYVVAAHEQLRGREATYALSTTIGPQDVAAAHRWVEGVQARIGPQDAAVGLIVETAVRGAPASAEPGAGGRVQQDLSARWVVGAVDDVYRRPLVTGSWPRAGTSGAPGVVLNEAAARRLEVTRVPATLTLGTPQDGTAAAAVVGVVADGLSEPTVYGTLVEAAEVWPASLPAGSATTYLRAGVESFGAAAPVLREAAEVAGIDLVDRDVRRVDTVEEARASARVVQSAFVACAVVALVVAGIGILNIGLASLSDRARELVVRRAVGARRLDVFVQVLGANLVVALIVSCGAVALAVLGVHVVAPALTPHTFVADPVTLPWPAVLNGTAAAVVTSLAGAAAPAVSATRLDVADALRS